VPRPGGTARNRGPVRVSSAAVPPAFPCPVRQTSDVADRAALCLELRRARCGKLPWRRPAPRCVGSWPRPARQTSRARSRAAASMGLCRVRARKAGRAARPHRRLPPLVAVRVERPTRRDKAVLDGHTPREPGLRCAGPHRWRGVPGSRGDYSPVNICGQGCSGRLPGLQKLQRKLRDSRRTEEGHVRRARDDREAVL